MEHLFGLTNYKFDYFFAKTSFFSKIEVTKCAQIYCPSFSTIEIISLSFASNF